MKLLIEKRQETEVSCLTEANAETNDKSYFIEGVFMQGDIKNRNNRMYPIDILTKSTDTYITEKVEKNRALGELGHPTNPSINLDRVSHKIISLKKEGTDFIGKAKILNTEMGKIVKSLMDEGVSFGVSSRGLGSLKESNNVSIVSDDYFIVTPADIVSDPSAPDAWITGLLENKEWAWDNGKLIEHEAEVRQEIDETVKNGTIDESRLIKCFEKFVSLI